MGDHLTRERISALLEDPQAIAGGLEHIGTCAECAREYEHMSRMRMALSGLPDLDPPAHEWDRIENRLGLQPHGKARAPLWRRAAGWPVQAAAVAALFAAGLLVGQSIGRNADVEDAIPVVGREISSDRSANAVPGDVSIGAEPTEAYLETAADLQRMLDHDLEANDWRAGPAAAIERITHLDAMIEASREALRSAPADPVLNNFLFQLVDERESLAGRLDETLRMTAAEY